jgi:hypothetical protein
MHVGCVEVILRLALDAQIPLPVITTQVQQLSFLELVNIRIVI